MKVRVRLFAEFKRVTGNEFLELEVSPDATVGDVVEATRAKFPALRPFEKSTLVAKGVEFAKPGDPVQAGDEICLMPPVMGG